MENQSVLHDIFSFQHIFSMIYLLLIIRSDFLHFCTLRNCLTDILIASIFTHKNSTYIERASHWICLTKCIMRGFIQNLYIYIYFIFFFQNRNVYRKTMQSSIKGQSYCFALLKKNIINNMQLVKVKQCCNVINNLQ